MAPRGPKKRIAQTTCPSGHALPKEGCTPMYCGMTTTALTKASPVKPIDTDKEEARGKLSFAISRKEAREELVPVPNLTGGEAEEYVEEKKVSLLPTALAEVEFQLKYGDEKARIEAARDVLRMNGMLNRDAPTGVAPTIVINMGNQKLPWQKKEDVVDAEVTTPKAR